MTRSKKAMLVPRTFLQKANFRAEKPDYFAAKMVLGKTARAFLSHLLKEGTKLSHHLRKPGKRKLLQKLEQRRRQGA
jgi:hypothetical protein